MATAHDWDSPLRLGCHHIASGLVRQGYEVGYITAAISPVQFLRDRRDYRERRARRRPDGEIALDGRLWAYTPRAMLTPHNAPFLGGRRIHRDWHRLTIPNVVQVVRDHGFADVDLLYIDSPTQLFWLDVVPHKASVARIGDRHAGFRGVSAEMLALERELVQRVDVVVCSASVLVEEVRAMGARRVVHLPNGVDFDHFSTASRALPADLVHVPRPIAVYAGEMAAWFDFELMNRLCEALPDVSFVFIGPDRIARDRLKPRDNIHIVGRRPYESLPGYLWNADVGLIPFDAIGYAELIQAVHPLKLYEYLACEVPTVATRWQEIEGLESPAILCEGFDQFREAIKTAIGAPPAPELGVDFARSADWSNRVVTLLDCVGLAEAPA